MFAEDATPKAISSMPEDMAAEANRLHILIHHAQVRDRLGVDIFEIAEILTHLDSDSRSPTCARADAAKGRPKLFVEVQTEIGRGAF